MINTIDYYVSKFFNKDTSVSQEDIDEITRGLSEKSYKLLTIVADSIKKSGKIDDEVWESLFSFKHAIALFAESFKTFFKDKKRGQIDFSEIRNLQFEKVSTQNLVGQDKRQMLSIAKHNWQSQGPIGKELLKKFESKLSEPGTEFYILKKSEEIIAFVRFGAPTEDGHRNGDSFNVDTNARSAGIGENFLLNAINQEAEQYILDAEVLPRMPIGMKYIHEEQFVILGLTEDEKNDEIIFKIQHDKTLNEKLGSKKFTTPELLDRLQQDSTTQLEHMIESQKKLFSMKMQGKL
jgi:predicted CopG family antitoxin